MTGPKVDHKFSFMGDRDAGANLVMRVEVRLKRRFHARKFVGAVAMDFYQCFLPIAPKRLDASGLAQVQTLKTQTPAPPRTTPMSMRQGFLRFANDQPES